MLPKLPWEGTPEILHLMAFSGKSNLICSLSFLAFSLSWHRYIQTFFVLCRLTQWDRIAKTRWRLVRNHLPFFLQRTITSTWPQKCPNFFHFCSKNDFWKTSRFNALLRPKTIFMVIDYGFVLWKKSIYCEIRLYGPLFDIVIVQ